MDPNQQPNQPPVMPPPPVEPQPQVTQPTPPAPAPAPVVGMPPAPSAPYGQMPVAGDDPGKTLGILSLCLSIFGIVGVILGIIGLVKSKSAHKSGILSIAGIILSVIFIILSWNVLVSSAGSTAEDMARDKCNEPTSANTYMSYVEVNDTRYYCSDFK